MKGKPNSEEKFMAALVHGSVILSFFGPVVPAILWSYLRRKSEYVRFHALQAMGYQALFLWLWIIAIIGIVILSFFLIIPVGIFMERTSADPTMLPFFVQPFVMLMIVGVFGLYALVGIVGAVMCFMEKEFRYPLLGTWLERYLSRGSEADTGISDAQEDNWVGGLCHLTVILQFMGLILPGIVWITQKDRSLRLKVQSMQSIVYLGIGFVAYIVWTAVIVFLFVAMILSVIAGEAFNGGGELPPALGLIILGAFLVIFLFGMLMSLLVPLYYLIALIAAVVVIRGNNFRYPVIGRLVERWMSREMLTGISA